MSDSPPHAVAAARGSSVAVVGAGVSGLTCAVTLREAGFPTRIITAAPPSQTTSMMAAAVWTIPGPGPGTKSFKWAVESRDVFEKLSFDPASGVSALVQRELETEHKEPLGWEGRFPWIRMLADVEVPEGYACGWRIDGFLIDPNIYLPWLRARFENGGGELEVRYLGRLDDAEADVIVNCTGLGARELCDDAELVPVRGQVVMVRVEGIKEAISDEHDPTRIRYIYPRRREVILGGSREAGVENLAPDSRTTERILSDCRELIPSLRDAEYIESRVGIRPGRSEVRLEPGQLSDGRPVIHNYGHGGQGFLLSWGCASQVTNLVANAL